MASGWPSSNGPLIEGESRITSAASGCARLSEPPAAASDGRGQPVPVAASSPASLAAVRTRRLQLPCKASARTGRGGENRKPWPNRTS